MNWLLYIYLVVNGQALQTSIAYLTTPLLNVALGVGEYLTRWGPGLLRLGAIMSFGGYCVSRPGLLRLGAVVG